ncbi:phosphoribosyl-ATP diphosphatase [Allofranklinella schreckenbergeri]|uniref:Phosphoribosyl-ATP pyrophosphatase n=1 Tax=Allofranklinella schreckenbergeri TaxID=1076744 RepID=A0A3M6QA54_9BURK|nr:phosphoribosyl-ATP diphosphatase [Allofranklinella schreckenbergeri]RMW97893.1 phosphoribosyl-ATP diphosphatase [Allofranklinella schreckenbergeri]RMW99939.1 phosphoribosyl-ATP diphosphatase [Allofranklinella schreckenbergeri]RRD43736.1 phosphoribosyl-ATP diphosphatase [Comamonadaceae bacterium OH3737_COT-264]
MSDTPSADALFAHLAEVFESRKPHRGGDPAHSYVARLLADGKAPDAFLKKIGEEAAELVMAVKDAQYALATAEANGTGPHCAEAAQSRAALVYEVADVWFHTLVALSHFNLSGADVIHELARREGLSGLAEKAARANNP